MTLHTRKETVLGLNVSLVYIWVVENTSSRPPFMLQLNSGIGVRSLKRWNAHVLWMESLTAGVNPATCLAFVGNAQMIYTLRPILPFAMYLALKYV
jgi:hypothetical protein